MNIHLTIYIRHYCRTFVLSLLFLTCWLSVAAGNDAGDYSALNRLSSAQLMEEGRNYFSRRDAAKALACFTIVSERKADDDESRQLRIRALNNCACVYKFSYYNYTKAYDYFVQAYEECEQAQYHEFLPTIMVNMGDLLNDYSLNYNSEQLAQQAHDIFERCMEKAVEMKNWELMTTAFFNLSNQNYELDLRKCNVLFSKEIPDSTPDIAFARLQYQAIRHIQHKDFVKARQCFEQQLQVIDTRWEPERDSLAALMSIAYTYRREQRYDQSVAFLQEALELGTRHHIADLAANICQQLSDDYRQLGDQQQADRYHTRYLEMMEETHSKQLAQIAELNYIHVLQKGEKDKQVLEERQFLQQMALLVSFVIIAIILVFVLLLWRKNKLLKERDKSLYEKYRQVMKIEADEQKLRKTYSKSNLNDEQREALICRIEDALSDPDIICQQDFTLNKLAKLINSNTTYVSQVINEKYGMAFSNLLGSHRIRIACQWMDDPDRYGNITIEAIAAATGFKSRTAFVNAFKRETGLKPSEYHRQAMAKRA